MKHRILIADDETTFAEAVAEFFVDRGYDARSVSSAESALALIPEFDPHIVVTDLRMPGRSGLALLEQLKASGDRRVIIMTAYADLPALWKSAHMHADGFVLKPLDMENLAAIVERSPGADPAPVSQQDR
jgi:DNA-binding NtrC family response regulator